MVTVILDGREMGDQQVAHQYMKRALNLSAHYGENLDALWDELSTFHHPLSIRFTNVDDMLMSLGEYGKKLLELFKEIPMYNKAVAVHFDDEI